MMATSLASVPEQVKTAVLNGSGVEGGEALGVVEDALVEVAAVHVERFGLALHRFDDVGMGVTDAGDVVVEVEVTAAVGVIQPDPFAADDVDGILIEGGDADAKQALAAGEEVGDGLFTHGGIVSVWRHACKWAGYSYPRPRLRAGLEEASRDTIGHLLAMPGRARCVDRGGGLRPSPIGPYTRCGRTSFRNRTNVS